MEKCIRRSPDAYVQTNTGQHRVPPQIREHTHLKKQLVNTTVCLTRERHGRLTANRTTLHTEQQKETDRQTDRQTEI